MNVLTDEQIADGYIRHSLFDDAVMLCDNTKPAIIEFGNEIRKFISEGFIHKSKYNAIMNNMTKFIPFDILKKSLSFYSTSIYDLTGEFPNPPSASYPLVIISENGMITTIYNIKSKMGNARDEVNVPLGILRQEFYMYNHRAVSVQYDESYIINCHYRVLIFTNSDSLDEQIDIFDREYTTIKEHEYDMFDIKLIDSKFINREIEISMFVM